MTNPLFEDINIRNSDPENDFIESDGIFYVEGKRDLYDLGNSRNENKRFNYILSDTINITIGQYQHNYFYNKGIY